MPKSVVTIRNLTKTYQMGDIEVRALRGVSLDVVEGELLAIMGPSGSGKSTLMNIMGCLDYPTSGDYLLDGTPVSTLHDDELAVVRNQKIGFVFQSFNLLARTSALANVELPMIYKGIAAQERHRRSAEMLAAVGLGERLDHKPSQLSGGQQQRVAIARALVNDPSLILADEPTGNLDSKASTEIMSIFQRLNEEAGITIVFVTHELDIAQHTKRIIHMVDGQIAKDERIANPIKVSSLN